jgi:voltage-gated potassium channel
MGARSDKGGRSSLGRSQGAYDRFAAAVDIPLTVLAVLWLPVLVLPLVAHLSASLLASLAAIDYFIWAVFAVEYLARLYLAPSRRWFVRHHLLDLVVVTIPVLRPLRILRLLRLFNVSRAGVVLWNALRRGREILAHRGLQFVLLAVLVIIFVAAGLELAFEHGSHGATIQNFGDALWWAIVTVTTVGYGDKYPVTAGGRGVAVALMFVGIGLIGVLTATVASYFVEDSAKRDKAALVERLERIEGQLDEVLARLGEQHSLREGSGTESAEATRLPDDDAESLRPMSLRGTASEHDRSSAN